MADPSGKVEGSLISRIRIIHALPLVPLLIVGILAAGDIRDNSFLWHIRAGAAQKASGSVLTQDVFSFTELGTSWRTQSWLAELFYSGAESLMSSLDWVNWMILGVAGLTILFIGLAVYHSVPSPITGSVVLLVMVWLLAPFLQPRPVIFSFAFLAALVVVLQHRERVGWLVIPIIWVWAGMHGSWVIGGLLVFLECIRTSDRKLFKVGAVALVSTLATAHGLGTWQILLDFFGSQEALDQMQEWQPPDFGGIYQMPYVGLIVGVIVGAVRGKIRTRDLVVIVPFLFLGMTSRRTVVPAAIVLVPWAAMALPAFRVPRSSTRPAVAVGAAALVGLLAFAPMASSTVGTLYPKRFPSADALAAIEGKNAFYDDGVGGYLIYAQWPDRLVWIDDRGELHGAERLMELSTARAGNYVEVFDEYGFDAALVKPDWSLTDRLIDDGWIVTYEDPEFVVLVP